jgi:cytoskeletal protein CcmA (bactofilin family)
VLILADGEQMAKDVSSPDRAQQDLSPEAREERRRAAWVGKSMRIEGKIISTDDLTIHGQVDGTIEVGDHSLVIGSGAAVRADLVARTITISGAVTGGVMASERIELRATGSVVGDLTAPVLILADGAVIAGRVEAGQRRANRPVG